MLDLSVLREKTWELKMFGGEILNIKRPTQKMVIEMMGFEEIAQKKEVVATIDGFAAILLDILNNNTNGRVYEQEYVMENFDFAVGMAVIEEYIKFATEINSNPN